MVDCVIRLRLQQDGHDQEEGPPQTGEPTLDDRLLFETHFPDSSTPGSTPVKAVMVSPWVNRETSPISAMS